MNGKPYIMIYWFIGLLLQIGESISVCEELDLFLFIDSSLIMDNSDDILDIIDTIVNDGSNEHSGFSVIVYGNIDQDALKKDTDIILLSIHDTKQIHRKKDKQKFMDKKFDLTPFKSIQTKANFVSVESAINIAMNYNKNKQKNNEEQKLIIFQKDTNIVTPEITCNLVDEYGGNIDFIYSKYSKDVDMDCDMNHQKYLFDDVYYDMNLLFDFTCPSEVNDPDKGWLKVSKKANYIEINTIKSCDFYYDDEGGLTDDSTIIVDNLINDDATYKKNTFILVKEDQVELLPEECQFPVFKIIDIDYGNDDSELILTVITPTIFEYITDADVNAKSVKFGKGKEMSQKKDNDKDRRRLEQESFTRDIISFSTSDSWAVGPVSGSHDFQLGETTVTGSGTIKIEVGYSVKSDFSGDVVLQYHETNCDNWFFDCPYDIDKLEMITRGLITLSPYFKLELSGTFSVSGRLKHWMWDYWFFINGIIPVIISPYIDISWSAGVSVATNAKIDISIPFTSNTIMGTTWTPSGGTRITKTIYGPGSPSMSASPLSNMACSLSASISFEIGAEIGIALVRILKVYAKPAFNFAPTFTLCDSSCGGPKVWGDLTFKAYIGGKIDFTDVPGWIKDYLERGYNLAKLQYGLEYEAYSKLLKRYSSCPSISTPCSCAIADINAKMIEEFDADSNIIKTNTYIWTKALTIFALIGINLLVIVWIFIKMYFCCRNGKGGHKYSLVSAESQTDASDAYAD